MSATTRPKSGLFSRLLEHLSIPLYRNGYALVFSSASSSLIGMLYWVLAARIYPNQAVGLNSAMIAAMMFLSGVAQVNLSSALTRFVPVSGKQTQKLVLAVYAASFVLAILVSLAFIFGVDQWSSQLAFLDNDIRIAIWFTLATMAWCIFVFQDSVLTGLRYATWVPVENVIYALVKIALLAIFARSIPQFGIFASWTLALIVSIIPTNIYIFFILIRRKETELNKQVENIHSGQIIRFAAADYLGSLFWLTATTFLPVIVTTMVGPAANATFYLTWTIAYAIYLLPIASGSSLIVEASIQPDRIWEFSRSVLGQVSKLVIPAVIVIGLAAPLILDIFGKSYSSSGSLLLRLLVLSAIPNMITALFISVAQVQRKMRSVVIVYGSIAGLVLLISFITLPIFGIVAVGVAWLFTQVTLASILYFTQFRNAWTVNHTKGYLHDMQKPINLESMTIGLKTSLIRIATDLHIKPGQLRIIRWPSRIREQNGYLTLSSKILSQYKNKSHPNQQHIDPHQWVVQGLIPTVSDMTVSLVGPRRDNPVAVLKIPRTEQSLTGAERQKEVLNILKLSPNLNGWQQKVPNILARGKALGYTYFLETFLPGENARYVLLDVASRERFIEAAISTIGELHEGTSRTLLIGQKIVSTWVDQPIETISKNIRFLPNSTSLLESVKNIGNTLTGRLAGNVFTTSWIHGDYVPGNILVSKDGSKITGIIDWELAREDELPGLDLVQLVLASSMYITLNEVGHIVKNILSGDPLQAEVKQMLITAERHLPTPSPDIQTLVLLAWLRHVSANMQKSKLYMSHLYWVMENVEVVLREF